MIHYEDISTAIQVRHLQVEMGEALCFDLDEDARDAVATRWSHEASTRRR